MAASIGNRIIKWFVLAIALVLTMSNCAYGELYSDSDRYSLYYEIKNDGTVEITGFGSRFINNLDEVVIPETIDGRTVTSIADRALAEDRVFSSVVIPDTVVEIGDNPFPRGMESINISPDHPKFALLDGVLFSKEDRRLICYPGDKLGKNYYVPEGIQKIGAYAFSGAKRLEEIIIPESVKEIGDFAFEYCEKINSINIPQSVTRIGLNPFMHCKTLKDITVYNNSRYESVDRVLFDKANNALVCFPFGLSDPYDWNAMKSYTIPSGTKTIEPYAFASGLGLNEIAIPDTVVQIKEYAFYQCRSLKSIHIPDSVTSVGSSAFRECYVVEELTFGSGLISIGDYAFSGFEKTDEIVLPQGLNSIGEGAFMNNVPMQIFIGPEKITVPSSVDSIGDNAFSGWDRLTVIVEKGSYAADYCKNNGLNYTYPDSGDWLTGQNTDEMPAATEDPVGIHYEDETETAEGYETAEVSWDDAVEVPVSQAQIDAMDGIVPCFGITRARLIREFNQVFDESGSWIANNYVPYQNLKDFPLLPDEDIVSMGIMSYFGKDKMATECFFVYDLGSGKLSEISGYDYEYDNCIFYHLDNTGRYYSGNVVVSNITVYIDGYWIRFSTGSYILSTHLGYDIIMFRNGDNNLYIEYEYFNRLYPDCPYIEMIVYDPYTY